MHLFSLCRDCGAAGDGIQWRDACPDCGSRRLFAHGELPTLSIAHLDCDSFFASVEKRDNPDLKHKPVIVGGEHRGVVAAACYVARRYGVRSAMPSARAKKLCPDAVFVRGNMEKYSRVGRQVRKMMRSLTPLVEPLSVDEAFMDLSGTDALHKGWPAQSLARLVRRIEDEVGITVSIGLSYNKFLAKIASDLDKPRGFAAIGRQEALSFLAPQPVSMIWGVGAATNKHLAKAGLHVIGDLQKADKETLDRVAGKLGRRLWYFSRGIDERAVTPPEGKAKSVSSEVTLSKDLSRYEDLKPILWRQCEKVARRLRKAGEEAGEVQLKLKTADFRILTRSSQLQQPGQLAELFFQAVDPLLQKECTGQAYRLIGFGTGKISTLGEGTRPAAPVKPQADLFAMMDTAEPEAAGPDIEKLSRLEDAMEDLRQKFGKDAIGKGRGLK